MRPDYYICINCFARYPTLKLGVALPLDAPPVPDVPRGRAMTFSTEHTCAQCGAVVDRLQPACPTCQTLAPLTSPEQDPVSPAMRAAVYTYEVALQQVIDGLLDLARANQPCGCGAAQRPFTYALGTAVYRECVVCGGTIA